MQGGTIQSLNDPAKKIKITDVAGLKRHGLIVGIGYRDPNPANRAINPFAAQFCEVEVNIKTGEVRILRFLSANDSGRVMSGLTFESQVIGGITMGIGLAMTEARILDKNQTGKNLTGNWHDYKIPTAMDVPADIASLPIDCPRQRGEYHRRQGAGRTGDDPHGRRRRQCRLQRHGRTGDIDADQPDRASPGAGGQGNKR